MLKAYRAYSDVKVTMYNQAMFSNQLPYVASGQAVEDLTNDTAELRRDSINYAGRPNSKPSVASVSGDTATVHDCFGNADWIAVYSSGSSKGKSAVAQGTTVTAHPITATLQQFKGVWLVTNAVTAAGPC